MPQCDYNLRQNPGNLAKFCDNKPLFLWALNTVLPGPIYRRVLMRTKDKALDKNSRNIWISTLAISGVISGVISGALIVATPASAQAELQMQDGAVQLEQFLGGWDVVRRKKHGAKQTGSGRRSGNRRLPAGPDIEGIARGDRRVYQIMTPAGRRAFEAMDPRDLPSNNCSSSGVPTLALNPNSQEWSREGDVLTIHHSYFNTVRKLYLDRRLPMGAPTQLGHAVARFEGRSLIITTNNMKASLGGLSRNAPGSDQRSVTERYDLSPDGQALTGNITVRDPVFLQQDITLNVTLTRAPADMEIPVVRCSVEASQRYLGNNSSE